MFVSVKEVVKAMIKDLFKKYPKITSEDSLLQRTIQLNIIVARTPNYFDSLSET